MLLGVRRLTLSAAMAYGTVVAAMELEGFSLDRLREITRADIDARLADFAELTSF